MFIGCTNREDALYEVGRYEGAIYTVLIKCGLTIQGDVMIEESTLNEVVRYFSFLRFVVVISSILGLMMSLEIDHLNGA